MRILIPVLAVYAAITTPLLADSDVAASAMDTKKIVQNNFVETAQKGIKLSGYVDAGYSYNFTGSGNQSMVATRYATDTAQRGDFNLYAFKLALEKAMTSENKAQAGFRADVMIGEDASYFVNRTPNAGYNTNNNSNTLFLEQAYAAIRAPVGNGWDFHVGKFVSTMGYEVIERPANLNVTYGILFNVMPLYYTGLLSSYKFDEYLDGKLGVVNGSNSDNNTTLNPNAGDGVALLASLNVTAPGGNANWSNNFQYSTGYDNNTDTGASNSSLTSSSQPARANNGNISAYMLLYNSWGNWSPKFADDKLLLAFNTVFGNLSGVAADGPANINTHWYGAGAYAKYQFNDWFSLSSRGEYLGSNNDGVLGYIGASTTHNTPEPNNPTRHVTGVNFWEYTLTASFNVIENVLIRAEYRMDWGANLYQVSSGAAQPEGANGPAYYAGAEIVYSF